MQKMADTLVELINPKAKIIQDKCRLRPEKSEVFRLFGDNTKIIQHTNWTVEHSLEQGLQETINWFSNPDNLRQYKAGIYNV
jgi:nucleoside-diphosphate-sugar epimerase